MRVPIFQLDAFTSRRFSGNPAAVMVMESFPPDATMQAIAAENNLAETAFLVPSGTDYGLRWFTPRVEVPLCGHATLASAAVVMERLEPDRKIVAFQSASGVLTLPVRRTADAYVMDFPARLLADRRASDGFRRRVGRRAGGSSRQPVQLHGPAGTRKRSTQPHARRGCGGAPGSSRHHRDRCRRARV